MPRTAARGGPQTRARIAEVAARLFRDHGFDAVTVAQVAREAGVSTVTVFNHFPRKEDLYLDRAVDAADLLRAAVRDRAPGADVLTSLQELTGRLAEERHPLSGTDGRSAPFFRTVAASPSLVARAREIAADLQALLAAELEADPAFAGDADLLAAFFVAGYASVLGGTAALLTAGEPTVRVTADHRTRLDRLHRALRHGVATAGVDGPAGE